jgi:hypothetical protein
VSSIRSHRKPKTIKLARIASHLLAKNTALWCKNKDLLVRYHDNVREWGEMSVYLLKQEQRLVGSLSG